MTVGEALELGYRWADAHAALLLAAGVAVPILGTLLARIGKAGRTDADGRAIASLVMGLAVVVVMAEIAALFVAHGLLGKNLLEANLALVAAPILCLVGSLLGIRWVFPLSELAALKTLTDLGLFALACAAVVWFFSKFRGWGIVFWGSVGQLVVLLVLGFLLLRRLYQRAFKTGGQPR